MAILVIALTRVPIDSMSGARAAGTPAGSARVQYAGHPSTDSTSNNLSAMFYSISLFLVLLRVEEGDGKMYHWIGYTLPYPVHLK